jgi:AcrR family transcriptional regulator
MSQPRNKRLPPHERRALIEVAAARLFAERGYDATRLDDVATAAGVTKPMLYRHFASKKDLHLALLAKHRDELAAHIALQAWGDAPLAERLQPMLDAWFSYVGEHPFAWRMLFRDSSNDPDIQAFHRELADRQRSNDVLLLREALGDEALGDDQLQALGEVMRSAMTGLARWWLEHPEVDRAVLVDTMLRLTAGVVAAP